MCVWGGGMMERGKRRCGMKLAVVQMTCITRAVDVDVENPAKALASQALVPLYSSWEFVESWPYLMSTCLSI